MRGQRLLIITLGVAILVTFCSSIEPNSTDTSPTETKGGKRNNTNLKERLSEMAKEFGATSFEETSEEMASGEDQGTSMASMAPKQHVKRLVSAEQNAEFQVYQGVMGRPGVDFPVLPSIPKTGFSCRQVKSSGYYADLDTDCQVFHICADGRKISFLCPNGTIFRQSHLICDWWWTVDCASSKEHYEESAELLANDRKIYQARSDALSKSRARQRGSRKPGIIREFEGASASVTSYSTEPSPRNARIQIHSKVINPSKQFSSSTSKPGNNDNTFSNSGFSRSSEEYQTGSSMEQAEQRSIHAFHPPFPETRTRRPHTGQYPENRLPSQNRQFAESRQEVDQYHVTNQFSQNIPPAPGAPEQRQPSQSNIFSEIQPPPLQPIVTTLRPKNVHFSSNRQLEQNLPERHFAQTRQNSQSRFVQNRLQSQQLQISQDLRPPQPSQSAPRQPQFRPEAQTFSQNKETNNGTRTYNHVRFFSSSDAERQLPAETGSFVNSRGNQLNGIRQTTPRPSKPRVTPVPQNRAQQASSKSYVELDRSRTNSPKPSSKPLKVALSQRKPIVVQVTDRGLTGMSNKKSSANDSDIPNSTDIITTEEIPFDDDGFPEPPSEEQFKDEDLFYLRGTTTQKNSNEEISTELPVTREPAESSIIGDKLQEGLSKPANDIQFRDEDVRGRKQLPELADSIQSTEPTNLSDINNSTTKSSTNEYSNTTTSLDQSSISLSTKRAHRFRTPTTSTTTETPTTSESKTVQHVIVSSTSERPSSQSFIGEKIILKKDNQDSDTTTKYPEESRTIVNDNFESSTERIKSNSDIVIEKLVRSQLTTTTSSTTSPLTSQTAISSTTEPNTRRLKPIFVEIIHRGSSEPPILKAFTVEELERKRGTTEPPFSAQEDASDSSSSISPETTISTKQFRSRTESSSSDTASVTTISPSSVTLSRRVRPPIKEDKHLISTPIPDSTITKVTTSIPPTTLYVTLSRRVQPPVLILTSSDPRDKNRNKSSSISPEFSTTGKEFIKTRVKSTTTEYTTPITPFTLSRRIQPPLADFNTSIFLKTGTQRRANRTEMRNRSETSARLQTVATDPTPRDNNINSSQIPIEVSTSEELLESTESPLLSSSLVTSTFKPTIKSTTYIEIQRRRTTTSTPTVSSSETQSVITTSQHIPAETEEHEEESIGSTTTLSNASLEIGNSIRETVTADPGVPVSLPLKQEPTISPQFGNRDGLEIPASSGPSTLHSLAVYYATKESNQETTSPTFDSVTLFDSKKRKGKEKSTTTSLPLSSSSVYPDSTTEKSKIVTAANETDTPISAPNFLTKSTRESYSALFPDTKKEQTNTTQQTSVTEESGTTTTKLPEKSSSKFKTKDRKTSDSSHNVLRSELLDKLAEISQMEPTPSTEKRTSTPERELYHSDTEDLLQGTDSRDLRELAQIFSRALSAYLEDPEEFKKVLTEVRPKNPPPLHRDEVRQHDSLQQQSTTLRTVTSSTSRPETSSTEYSSVTQEDEEVLDFSDVSKVSRKKSKSTTTLSPPSKSTKSPRRKVYTSTITLPPVTVSDINGLIESSSRKNEIIETATKASRISAQKFEEASLKPPLEQLQKAQSTYYPSSSSKRRPSSSRASVSAVMVVENSPSDEEIEADYSLPTGTKQYDGPGYGPQSGEPSFAPTAGGVSDPSRPRYGGFQNNSKPSKISQEEVLTDANKRIDTDEFVIATTLSPTNRYQTRSTSKPKLKMSRVETSSDNVEKEVPAAIGNILNTFIPEEVNNLAILGNTAESQTNLSLNSDLSEENKPHNLKVDSDEALVGANTASFSSSRLRQSSNKIGVTGKWTPPANIVDALTINRELSASDNKEEIATIDEHEPTEEPRTNNKPMFKSRNRSTSTFITPETTTSLEDSEVSTTTTFTTMSSTLSTTTSSPILQKSRSKTVNLNSSVLRNEGFGDDSNPEEELQASNTTYITFHSEKVKPPPPSSASLIRTTIPRENKVESLITASTNKYQLEEVSVADDHLDEIVIVTTPSTTTASKLFISSQRKSSSRNRFSTNEQSIGTAQELRETSETLIKDTTNEPLEISHSPGLSTPTPFTETTLSDTLPTEHTTTTRKQLTKLNDRIQIEQKNSILNRFSTQSSTIIPETVSSTSTRTRRIKYTTTKQPSFNEQDDVEILKEDLSKKDFVVLNTPLLNISSTETAIIKSSSVPIFSKDNTSIRRSKSSQRQKLSSNREVLGESKVSSNFPQSTTTISPSPEGLISSNIPTMQTFTKIRSSSTSSKTSIPSTHSKTNMRMDGVTSEQLQALEDLQTMLFPNNSTITEDGTMFGNLNQSSTLSLINTMKQAVTNSTVRRLVLLLVNSLKENTPAEARSQLIEALLRMPVDREHSESQRESVSILPQQIAETSSEKSSQVNGKEVPVNSAGNKSPSKNNVQEVSFQESTIKSSDSDIKYSTSTLSPSGRFRTRGRKKSQTSTTPEELLTTTVRSKGRRPVRLRTTTETIQADSSLSSVEGDAGFEDLAREGDSLPQSDTRAVELLRSLYSLASRWG